jgi:hypothetical protein
MRFSTKALLVAFFIVALWLSTFAGYPGANDVHSSIMLVIATSAATAIIYGRGKTQAFAIAFLAILFLAGDYLRTYDIDFRGVSDITHTWADSRATNENHRHWLNLSFLYAIICGWSLILATIAGFAATLVYEYCKSSAANGMSGDLPR